MPSSRKRRKTINQIIVLSSIPAFPFFTKPRDLLLSRKVIIFLRKQKIAE
jgi:hypothetical protein